MELDVYIVATVLAQVGRIEAAERAAGKPPRRYRHQSHPAQPARPCVRGGCVRCSWSATPASIRTTSPSSARNSSPCRTSVPLQRQVKALRRLGFGFAVDDAGAGYASFALIAALRPSVIKIDREIVHGISHDDAKQALVEAFVSFGRRIGAHLLAEGIERRADLAALAALDVEFGQGISARTPGTTNRRRRVG